MRNFFTMIIKSAGIAVALPFRSMDVSYLVLLLILVDSKHFQKTELYYNESYNGHGKLFCKYENTKKNSGRSFHYLREKFVIAFHILDYGY